MTRWSTILAAATLAAGLPAAPSRAAAAGLAETPTQFELAGAPTVKLVVRGAGWTRVSQPALLAAGLDPAVDPGQLRLFADGIEQGIRVTGNGDATFDANEAIEFYGVGRDTLWTDARTYWLWAGADGTPGKALPLVANPRGNPAPASFTTTASLTQKKYYQATVRNGDTSNFFADFVNGAGATETLTATHLAPAEPSLLRVALQGINTGSHVLAISLNGQALGDCAFGGQSSQICFFDAVPAVEGNNQLTLVAHGDTPDYSLLAAAELDYPHVFTADADVLTLTAPPASRIAIGGFSSSDVRVVDVTDPDSAVELVTGLGFDAAATVASVSTAGDTSPHTLYAFTDAAVRAPVSVTGNRPSAWSASSGAELVILSNAEFVDAVRPLADRRTQEGWSVALVDLQDVYDEFGGGDETVFAVRDFLRYAHTHWSVPPRFVLLVGDASFDPRNFLGRGDLDFAPTKLIDTAEMETSSDDWVVDWNSDGVPDIAIGRLSVRTAAEAATVVGKTLAYPGVGNLPRGGLFVADQSDGPLDFEGSSRTSETTVSDIMPIDSFFLSQATSTPAALIAKLNGGPFLVNYLGHGSVTEWDGLLTDTDATALTNPQLSIYIAMNCLNGFFHDIYSESLAESLTKAPHGGAVAVWASSTLGSFDSQAVLNQEFLKRLTRTSLGEAAMAAKAAITDPDARRTWILFGDPTLFGTPGSKGGGIPPGGSDAGGPDASPADASLGDASPGDASPADASARDAGAFDARSRTDGGSEIDGGSADGAAPPGPSSDGCGCQLDPRRGPNATGLLALGIVALTARRRPRRRRPTQAYDGER